MRLIAIWLALLTLFSASAATPTANSQVLSVSAINPTYITLTGSSAIPNSLQFTILSAPLKGTLTGTAPSLIYTPSGSIGDTDTFTFKVNDGTGDSAPATAILFLDDHTPLAQTVRSLSYTPVAFALSASDIDSGRGDGTWAVERIWSNTNGLTSSVDQVRQPSLGSTSPFGSSGYSNFVSSINPSFSHPFFMDPVTLQIAAAPAHGTLTISPSYNGITPGPLVAVYTATGNFIGTDSATFNFLMDGNVVATGSLTVNVIDSPPSVSIEPLSATPVIAGAPVSFLADGIDPDNTSLSYMWDFGDGSTDATRNPVHAYMASGVFTATVTVQDPSGLSASDQITVTVLSPQQSPLAAFVTSTLNGTVGQPVGFDATFSTDPANNIASYTWNFGDGSPSGSGVVIAHIYSNPGSYVATLTVTNGLGLRSTTSAAVVIVQAATGASTPLLLYSARFNTKKTGADSLEVTAQLNPGVEVTNATPLGIEISGNSFVGTSASFRALKSGPQVQWKIKTVKNAHGVMLFHGIVRNATLIGFPSTSGSFTTPVKFSVGTITFSTPVTNQFRFGLRGGISTAK